MRSQQLELCSGSRLAHFFPGALIFILLTVVFARTAEAEQAKIEDHFVFQDIYAPRNHHPVIVQPWNAAMRRALQPLLTQVVSAAPGLIQRARAFGRIELYWVKEGRGAAFGAATSYKPLNAIFFSATFEKHVGNTKNRKTAEKVFQLLIHEITHLADVGLRYSDHPAWTKGAQPILERVRQELKLDLSKGAPGADDLPKKRVARKFGLASGYAAIDLVEALAEVTADVVTDRSYRAAPELERFVTTHLLSREPKPDPAAMKFSAGLRHWHFGALDRAAAEFEEALNADPTFGAAYLYRGLVREREPKTREAAMADFSKAIEHSFGQNAAEAYLRRGRHHTNERKFELAEKDLDQHFELRPWRWESSFFRGVPRLFLGNLDLALADFNRAAAFRINHPWIFYFRAETHRRMKQCKEAIADYVLAIKYNIGQPDLRPYEGRASCHVELNNFDAAVDDYSALIKLEPTHPKRYGMRGELLEKMGKCADAVADYGRAIELAPKIAWAYARRATCRIKLKDSEGAIADLSTFIRLQPRSVEARVDRARLYGANGRYAEAIADLEFIKRIDPSRVPAVNRLITEIKEKM